MRFLLKYPTRSRPNLFITCIERWWHTASRQDQVQWLVSADADDATMNNPEIRDWCEYHKVPIHFGDNRTKVGACNADMDKAGKWDVLVLVSDDMIPVAGWDSLIAEHMPDDLRMGLWFPDGRQTRLCTLSIFGRPIFEEVLGGYIYHPEFKSVYCDNYYHDLMTKRGLLKFVDVPAFRHAWREQNDDALMQRNECREWYNADRRTYHRLIGQLA